MANKRITFRRRTRTAQFLHNSGDRIKEISKNAIGPKSGVGRVCTAIARLPDWVKRCLRKFGHNTKSEDGAKVMNNQKDKQKILLTSIGKTNYSESSYALGDRLATSKFAPAALAQLLDLRGWHCKVIATSASAEQNYAEFETSMKSAGLIVELLDVPAGHTEDELFSIVRKIASNVPHSSEVILDVTLGLRHLPFMYLAALIYLSSLADVEIKGIYYGALELKGDSTLAPILELHGLFELISWFHSIKTAQETGNFHAIVRMLEKKREPYILAKKPPPRELTRLRDTLGKLAPALNSGLPLETGANAYETQVAIAKYAKSDHVNTLISAALTKFSNSINSWAIEEAVAGKTSLMLSDRELLRQLSIIDWYLGKEDFPKVYQLLREWLVSLYHLKSGQNSAKWLAYKDRKPSERHLNSLSQKARLSLIEKDSALQLLTTLWDTVSSLRNQYMHAGMTTDTVSLDPRNSRDIVVRCRKLLSIAGEQFISPGKALHWLVSPLGHNPGSLFTAVKELKPDRLLIITSKDAEPHANAVLQKVGESPDLIPIVCTMNDPLAGFEEAAYLLNSELKVQMLASSRVTINITGGTTAMQYVAEKIGKELANLGAEVAKIATIDRRSTREQTEIPFVLGEVRILS